MTCQEIERNKSILPPSSPPAICVIRLKPLTFFQKQTLLIEIIISQMFLPGLSFSTLVLRDNQMLVDDRFVKQNIFTCKYIFLQPHVLYDLTLLNLTDMNFRFMEVSLQKILREKSMRLQIWQIKTRVHVISQQSCFLTKPIQQKEQGLSKR